MSGSSETLHVLTACSRPENLPYLAASLDEATCEPFELHWHIRFDFDRVHVGGQKLKNQMLNEICDGWVYILDDDTTVHPDLFREVAKHLDEADAFIVAQERADGRYLHARPELVRVGDIDIGQAVLYRDLIGTQRIPTVYEGDGIFLQAVLTNEHVCFIDRPLSRHNQLQAVTV